MSILKPSLTNGVTLLHQSLCHFSFFKPEQAVQTIRLQKLSNQNCKPAFTGVKQREFKLSFTDGCGEGSCLKIQRHFILSQNWLSSSCIHLRSGNFLFAKMCFRLYLVHTQTMGQVFCILVLKSKSSTRSCRPPAFQKVSQSF